MSFLLDQVVRIQWRKFNLTQQRKLLSSKTEMRDQRIYKPTIYKTSPHTPVPLLQERAPTINKIEKKEVKLSTVKNVAKPKIVSDEKISVDITRRLFVVIEPEKVKENFTQILMQNLPDLSNKPNDSTAVQSSSEESLEDGEIREGRFIYVED